MKKPEHSKPGQAGDDAGGAWRPSRARLAIAVLFAVVVGAGLVLLWMPTAAGPRPDAAAAQAPPPSPSAAPLPAAQPHVAQAPLPRTPEGDADPTRDLSSYVARGENPTMPEVIERLHERGIHSGLGAFPPPGTSPPLVGLAVAEDFPLPPGYVRHHQATDDGQRIEAILMFAPGFQLYDANHQPIEMPKNGVVPPELAPPGLPIRRITIPPAIAQARPGS